jgi:hypothetical protein
MVMPIDGQSRRDGNLFAEFFSAASLTIAACPRVEMTSRHSGNPMTNIADTLQKIDTIASQRGQQTN